MRSSEDLLAQRWRGRRWLMGYRTRAYLQILGNHHISKYTRDRGAKAGVLPACRRALRLSSTCAGMTVLNNAGLGADAAMMLEPGRALSGCTVTTTAVLNFRDGPKGELAGNVIPASAMLTAPRRTTSWIKEDYHGVQGWISADYVTTQGVCG